MERTGKGPSTVGLVRHVKELRSCPCPHSDGKPLRNWEFEKPHDRVEAGCEHLEGSSSDKVLNWTIRIQSECTVNCCLTNR